jgi:predicted ester cyclase
MSEANKLLARRWFDEVWNQKNEAAIDEMFHPQGKVYGFPDANSVLEGPEAFKTVHRTFCGAFPDLHINIEDVIAEGDRVAIRWRVVAIHRGDHLGFAASGKKAVLDGSSFVVVRGNQIIDGWNQMDMQAFLQKLQAIET